LITLFAYPTAIRKVIYTTNAIETLNSVIRIAVNNRKVFPTDASVTKVIYLAVEAASKQWSMPIRNWKAALLFHQHATSLSRFVMANAKSDSSVVQRLVGW